MMSFWTVYTRRSKRGVSVSDKLRSVEEFAFALRAKGPEIVALEGTAIDDPKMNVYETGKQVWHLIDTLGIVDNKTRIVPGTKALHHLLPELVVPMDRAYTQRFFCWQNPTFQYEQQRCFDHAFAAFADVARKANPAQYVGHSGWHTSRTKVIDNALIGLIFDQEKPGIKEDEVAPSLKSPPESVIGSVIKWFKSKLAVGTKPQRLRQ
jgi:hypothetical protein